MSSRRRVNLHREKLADRLAAERRKVAPPVGMAAVLERLAERGRSGSEQLKLGEGARPNIMAPSKYFGSKSPPTVNPINILQQGVDSVWLNIHASLKEDVAECLAMAKEDALEADGDRAESPLPPFDGVTPMMLASGLPYYEWHLRSRDVDVQIRKPSKRSFRAAAVIRISAECLWRMGDGGRRAMYLAADWLRPLFLEEGYSVKLSHGHIATDFQGYVPTVDDMLHTVRRADETQFSEDDGGEDSRETIHRDRGRRLTGFSAGKSTNIRLNFYDKRLQARKKHLDWVPDLWERAAGYNPDLPVWRVEFQFGREFLHGRGIETLDDFWDNLGSLWAYGMGWYSFRTLVPDTNRSRWPVAPWWAGLSSWRTVDAGELPKIKQVRPIARQLVAGGVGYMLSYMAVTGIDDPAAAWRAMQDQYISTKTPLAYEDGGRLRYSSDHGGVLDAKLAAKRRYYQGFTMGAV